jgi:hypothetical protein
MTKSISAALIISTLLIIGCDQENRSGAQTGSSGTPSKQSGINSKPSQLEKQDLVIYSGDCIQYRRDIVAGNQIRYTEVSRAFSKIIINPTARKFSFFYDADMVFTNDDYMSFIDDEQGGEGFTFIAGLSAFNQFAEKTFTIIDNQETFGSPEPSMGYEYILVNYNIN